MMQRTPTAAGRHHLIGQDVEAESDATFVVLPGPWQHPDWWLPFQADLDAAGCRSWIADWPGRAPEDPASVTVTLAQLADWVLDQIATQPTLRGESDDRDLVLLAHSAAGPIAQLVAATLPPQRIKAVIFVGAWVLADGVEDELLIDLLPYELHALREAAISGTEHGGIPVAVDAGLWADRFDPGGFTRDTGPAGVCPAWWLCGHGPWQSWWDLLAGRPWPVHYVVMVHDQVLPLDLQQQMVMRLIPEVTVALPGGWLGVVERPHDVADAVLALLGAPTRHQPPLRHQHLVAPRWHPRGGAA